MTFPQMRLSLQLIAEERVGTPRYLAALRARQEEDAIAAAAAGAVDGPS